MPQFAELLGRSNFSFLRGASHPEELVERASELGLAALGLCDRDGLYGSARAHVRASELGQRLIVGAELTVGGGLLSLPGSKGSATGGVEPQLVALLVENQRGYSNLCRLLTRSHGGRPKGECQLEPEWLGEHAEGLVALVPAPSFPGSPDTAGDELLGAVRDAFGPERAALAAYRRLDGFDEARTATLHEWSQRYGLPIVASARPEYHHRSRKPLADVVHCIREGTTLDRAGTALSASSEAFLRSDLQMRRLFRDAEHWVDRAGELAEGLRFNLGELHYEFPCQLAPGVTADEELRRLTFEGAQRRYPGGVPEKVRAQLEKELGLIAELEVAPYFLSTREIVEIAREKRILCQGRGSAANSAVCYVLGITAVDPARSSLLFERFMSPERREPPDIDIDFEHERREEVIQEIYARYGRDRAGMVSEVICYRGKSSVREVGKVFGLSLEQVDRLSSSITFWDSAATCAKRLEENGFDARDQRLRHVVMLARALEGFPRHLSIHVGGFVLSAQPLYEVAPVEPARMQDRTVVPWDKDDIEALGFFKVDVLGLGMLTAIRKALALMHRDAALAAPTAAGEARSGGEPAEAAARDEAITEPEPFDPLEVVTRIPAEDPEVYDMVSRADTVGVFQIESRAQMSMLPRLRPRCFYDLVIEVAIVRPGPIQGGMVHPYLRRRNGEEEVRCPHSDLWPILERTLGVPLFQEQVMEIAIVGAGYSGGEADQLRRDMAAWKKSGKLLRHRQRLLDGFAAHGISRDFGEALFEQIKGFGDYGFPESHAASFALLVYVSSWQKRHFPAHFACALLNAQPMGFYTASAIIQDAQRHGVEVRDTSIVHSEWDNTLEPLDGPPGAGADEDADRERSGNDARANEVRRSTGGREWQRRIDSRYPGAQRALRLGLREIKGLREEAGRRIESARQERAFVDLGDLVRRTGLRKNEVEALAEAGALEELVRGRRQALWRARSPRTGGLFEQVEVREPMVDLPPLGPAEQLLLDYDRKGLSVGDHPLRYLRPDLDRRGVLTTSDLLRASEGRAVEVAGVVTCRQRPGTASGVVFITLEDETGSANCVVFSSTFEKLRHTAMHASMLLARGSVERVNTPELRPGPGNGLPKSGPGSDARPSPATTIVHLVVEDLERLDVPGRSPALRSRDFH